MAYQGNTAYQGYNTGYGQQQSTPSYGQQAYGQQDNTYAQYNTGYNSQQGQTYGQQAYGQQAYGQQTLAYGADSTRSEPAPAYGGQQGYSQGQQQNYQSYNTYSNTVPTTTYGGSNNQATTAMKMGPSTPLVPPAEGKWRSALCTCCGDMCICMSVCCCHAVTAGQLYERAVQKNMLSRIPMVSCLTVTLIILVLELSQNITSYIFTSAHYQQNVFGDVDTSGLFKAEYWQNMTMHSLGAGDMDRVASHHATIILGVSELAALLALFCMCAITCTVRAAIRKRDNIPSNCLGGFEDCVCAACCNVCTQCMLLRHEKESSPVGSDGYSLCHPTAFPL
jgi:Cys-rich protein (TIGR01571 family)